MTKPSWVRACKRCTPHAANWLFTPALIARCRRNSARSTNVFGSMFCLRTGPNRTPAPPSNHASISLLLSALSPVKHRGRPSSWLQVIAHAA